MKLLLPITLLVSLLIVNNVEARWQPTQSQKYNIVLGQPIDITKEKAEIIEIDLFKPKDTIKQYQKAGKKVICYFSAGTIEKGRDDYDKFSEVPGLVRNIYGAWPDERWLDYRVSGAKPLIKARIQMGVDKGCDAVEVDNVDGYQIKDITKVWSNPLTKDDAKAYLKWLGETAHSLGISIGIKNCLDIIDAVGQYFEFGVNEGCIKRNECYWYKNFLATGKPVFGITYNGLENNREALCRNLDGLPITMIIKPGNRLVQDAIFFDGKKECGSNFHTGIVSGSNTTSKKTTTTTTTKKTTTTTTVKPTTTTTTVKPTTTTTTVKPTTTTTTVKPTTTTTTVKPTTTTTTVVVVKTTTTVKPTTTTTSVKPTTTTVNNPVTSDRAVPTTQATTSKATTTQATSSQATTQATTSKAATTQATTTQASVATQAAVSQATTQATTTQAASSQAAATQAVSSQAASSQAAATQAASSQAASSQAAATQAATTQATTTQAPVATQATSNRDVNVSQPVVVQAPQTPVASNTSAQATQTQAASSQTTQAVAQSQAAATATTVINQNTTQSNTQPSVVLMDNDDEINPFLADILKDIDNKTNANNGNANTTNNGNANTASNNTNTNVNANTNTNANTNANANANANTSTNVNTNANANTNNNANTNANTNSNTNTNANTNANSNVGTVIPTIISGNNTVTENVSGNTTVDNGDESSADEADAANAANAANTTKVTNEAGSIDRSIEQDSNNNNGGKTTAVVTGVAITGGILGAAAVSALFLKNPKKYQQFKRSISFKRSSRV